MATATAGPTALKRWLGFEFKRLREVQRPKINRAAAADRIGRTEAFIGQIETASRMPSPSDTEVLLGYYGVPERVADFRELMREAKKGKNWWAELEDAAPSWFELYLGLESSAVQYQRYDALTVPGLFQTADYAAAIIRAGNRELTSREIGRRVELRTARAALAERDDDPMRVWIVLDEAALRRHVGGPAVLRAQIERLVELSERPNIDFQLLPADAGAHAGVEGSFTILTFPEELVDDPGLAYVETRIRGVYYEKPHEINQYRDVLTRLQVQALKPEDTPAALLQIAKEIT